MHSTLVLNLDRRPDRWQKFKKNNRHIGRIERYSAVDGPLIAEDRKNRPEPFAHQYAYYYPGTIGNHLSHRNCWDRVRIQNEPATIAEDDAVFHPQYPTQRDEILRGVDLQYDVIFWGWTFSTGLMIELYPGGPSLSARPSKSDDADHTSEFLQSTPTARLYRAWGLWNSFAYTLSPNGAERLLDLAWPIVDENGVVPMSSDLFPIYGVDAKICAILDQLDAYVAIDPLAYHPHLKSDTDMLPPGHTPRVVKLDDPIVPNAPTLPPTP